MKKYFLPLVFLLLLLPLSVYAASMFEPSSDDRSILLLRNLFGEVPGVLELGGPDLLTRILSEFNNAVLVLGGIVIMYSLLVSTINTANEGEMLGKNWNSVWIPIRAAFGFALLVPVKAGSYSLIQVFVMWVIIQGVGAADTLWSVGINSIQTGSAAAVPTTSPSAYNSAQNIFLRKVCQKQAAKSLLSSASYSGGVGSPDLKFGVSIIPTKDVCGAVNFKYPTGSLTPLETQTNQAINAMARSSELDSAAEQYVNSYKDGKIDMSIQFAIQNKIKRAADQYNTAVTTTPPGSTGNLSAELNRKLEQSKKAGWISAGSYFLEVSEAANENVVAAISGPGVTDAKITELENYMFPDDYKTLTDMLRFAVTEQVGLPPDMIITNNSTDSFWAFINNNIIKPITGNFLILLGNWQVWLTGEAGQSPILSIQSFGITMTNIIAAGYLLFVVFVGAAKAALGAAAAVATWGTAKFIPLAGDAAIFIASVAYLGISNLIAMITPAILALLVALFAVGMTLGFYVPLIPYVVFTLAAIGWLILTVEAMVAAPLMAIGILHPEGTHQVLGKADAGIMILASVFLRPGLMIVGFFAAILMSYVVVGLINMGIFPAAQSFASKSPFAVVFIMVIYTMLILIGLNKAFSLIYIIPDRILRWIGTQQSDTTSVESELGQLKGGAEKAGGEVSRGVAGAGDYKKAKILDQGTPNRDDEGPGPSGGFGAR